MRFQVAKTLFAPAGSGWAKKQGKAKLMALATRTGWELYLAGFFAFIISQPHTFFPFAIGMLPFMFRVLFVLGFLFTLKGQYARGKWHLAVFVAVLGLMHTGNYFGASLLYTLEYGKGVLSMIMPGGGAFFMLSAVVAALKLLLAAVGMVRGALSAPSADVAAVALVRGSWELATQAMFNLMVFFPQPAFATFFGGVFNSGDATKELAFWVSTYAVRLAADVSGRWDAQLYAAIPPELVMSRRQYALFRTFTPAQSACIVLGDMLMKGFVFDKNRRAGALGSFLMGAGLLSAGVTPTYGFWIPAAFCCASAVVHAATGWGVSTKSAKGTGATDIVNWAVLGLAILATMPVE